MFTPHDVELLKTALSARYSNFMQLIVDQSGLTRNTVSKFFNNRKIKPSNQELIYVTGKNLLEENVIKRNSLTKEVRNLAKGEIEEGKQTVLNLSKTSTL